jgi:hypothetical protein
MAVCDTFWSNFNGSSSYIGEVIRLNFADGMGRMQYNIRIITKGLWSNEEMEENGGDVTRAKVALRVPNPKQALNIQKE